MIKAVSWNMAAIYAPLEELLAMDADIALLQEVRPGMWEYLNEARESVAVSPYEPWFQYHPTTGERSYDRWPVIVKLSDRVEVEWFKQVAPTWALAEDEMSVSDIGAIAAARVIPLDGREPFIVVSMYARWHRPHPVTGGGWIHSDAAAHRIISDLTAFVPYYDADEPPHRILAAGDLNVDYDDFGRGTDAFSRRANTIFGRMSALGLEYVGPQHPNGRQADPRPEHLPEDTKNVATYYSVGSSPANARLQLDHVFASRGFHHSVRTRARNGVNEWGSSDHCRIVIEVGN